jgi:hypothetical protein
MTRLSTPLSTRLTSAALAVLMGVALLATAYRVTYTGAAGLPIVELERVVVTAGQAIASTDPARPVN